MRVPGAKSSSAAERGTTRQSAYRIGCWRAVQHIMLLARLCRRRRRWRPEGVRHPKQLCAAAVRVPAEVAIVPHAKKGASG